MAIKRPFPSKRPGIALRMDRESGLTSECPLGPQGHGKSWLISNVGMSVQAYFGTCSGVLAQRTRVSKRMGFRNGKFGEFVEPERSSGPFLGTTNCLWICVSSQRSQAGNIVFHRNLRTEGGENVARYWPTLGARFAFPEI